MVPRLPEPPAVVVQVLQERGVEVEVEGRPRPEPGQRCELCARTGHEDFEDSFAALAFAPPATGEAAR